MSWRHNRLAYKCWLPPVPMSMRARISDCAQMMAPARANEGAHFGLRPNGMPAPIRNCLARARSVWPGPQGANLCQHSLFGTRTAGIFGRVRYCNIYINITFILTDYMTYYNRFCSLYIIKPIMIS
jgi:hypothetical protein